MHGSLLIQKKTLKPAGVSKTTRLILFTHHLHATYSCTVSNNKLWHQKSVLPQFQHTSIFSPLAEFVFSRVLKNSSASPPDSLALIFTWNFILFSNVVVDPCYSTLIFVIPLMWCAVSGLMFTLLDWPMSWFYHDTLNIIHWISEFYQSMLFNAQ